MRNYEERRQARIDGLKAAAERKRAEAEAAYKKSTDMMSVIPMGQPIMIGHCSEKRDRNYRERAWNAMGKSVAASNAADELESRAIAAEGNTAISSDDPEAVVKMREKIAALEAEHATNKAGNAKLRKAKLTLDDPALREKLAALELPSAVLSEVLVLIRVTPYHCKPYIKLPAYAFSNATANINRCKKRLAELERVAEAAKAEPTEKRIGDIAIEEHPEENRIWLVFPGKPSREAIARLKSHGFRWSPTDKAWKRHLNNSGRYAAEHVAKESSNG